MTTFAGIRIQTLKVSTTAMESSDCCGRRRVMARQRPTTGSLEQGLRPPLYPYAAPRGPTYRENSHANHTWHQHSHQTACFKDSEAPPVWVRFPSPAPFFVAWRVLTLS